LPDKSKHAEEEQGVILLVTSFVDDAHQQLSFFRVCRSRSRRRGSSGTVAPDSLLRLPPSSGSLRQIGEKRPSRNSSKKSQHSNENNSH
jgi:hypothetical protein